MPRKAKIIIVFLGLALLFLTAAGVVLAADNSGPDVGLDYAAETGLSAANDPRVIAANIIRIVLGFLGIVAVGLIIYAGWLWMTANGEAEKIDKAKKILLGAVIGLIICLASFAIASFILSKLLDATGATGDGSVCDPPCSSGQYCCSSSCSNSPCGDIGGGSGYAFSITSTRPKNQDTEVVRNVVVKTFFNKSIADTVNQSVLDSNFKVEKIATIDPSTKAETALAASQLVTGVKSFANGRMVISFADDDNCGDASGTLNCLPAWSKFKVTVNSYSGIISVNNQSLNCASGSNCQFVFSTGDSLDTDMPKSGIVPTQMCYDDGSLKADANTVTGWGKDAAGISALSFNFKKSSATDDQQAYLMPGSLQTYQSASYKYDTSALAIGDEYKFSFYAYDLADHLASSSFTTTIKPGHCCNGVKDADEIDADCGGQDCLSCFGGPCNKAEPNVCGDNNSNCSDSLCSTWFCDCKSADGCRCGSKPMIFNISPLGGFCANDKNKFCSTNADCGSGGSCNLNTPNGSAGNFVTISGRYFGSTAGKVYFNNNQQASLAVSANANCTNSWQDNQIIVSLPGGAVDGSVKVVDANNNFDTTDDDRGPYVQDFLINNIKRPGVCLVNPDYGYLNDPINLQGNSFNGNSPAVLFGNSASAISANNISNWTNTSVNAAVPNLQAGSTSIFVRVNSIDSNNLIFKVKSDSTANPSIEYIDPSQGPSGQYVTIYGRNFKTYNAQASAVKFYLPADPQNLINADIDFPEACRNNWWHDTYIIVKVPKVTSDKLGGYKVVVINGDGKTSAAADFTINNEDLKPGLCSLDPNNGPIGWPVTASGEYFGSSQGSGRIQYTSSKDGATRGWSDKKIESNVPSGAVSGSVKVIDGQAKISNSLPFKVGKCSFSSDCEGGQECCGGGTYWSGICRPSGTCEQGSPIGCGFGWTFSTKSGQCAADQEKCDLVNAISGNSTTFNCCARGQCNGLTGQCDSCPVNKPDQCGGDLKCCSSGGCQDIDGDGRTECADAPACSSYSTSQCNNSYFCPNSPGKCSVYGGGSLQETGDCDYSCNGYSSCQTDQCEYKRSLNKCVKKSKTCSLPKIVNYTIGGTQTSGTATCQLLNGQLRWVMAVSTSCPSGWANLGSGRCAENNIACSACDTGFTCAGETTGGQTGSCAINQTVCPSGSTCSNAADHQNKCVKTDNAGCECCCRIGHSSEDCCAPLECSGKCGSDRSGTGTNTYGSCTGCGQVGATQAEHNAACNCSGTSGKYCLINSANPTGVCSDCAQISDADACSQAGVGTCCVDAKNNNTCRGGTGQHGISQGGGDYAYCAYYTCGAGVCSSAAVATSTLTTYETTAECNNKCASSAKLGSNCSYGTGSCDLSQCQGFSCLNEDGSGPQPPSDCGICCCDPKATSDQCKTKNPQLSCMSDKGNCTGSNRGLCCGCSRDSDCGDINLVGCGSDTCCQARPKVAETMPVDGAGNSGSDKVCRNSLIQAAFDQPMQINTFGSNIVVAAEYGADPCPSNSKYLTEAYKPTLLSRLLGWLAKLPLLNKILINQAQALSGNFCTISGSVSGYNFSGGKKTVLEFRPQQILEPNRKYYVIIKGDSDFNDNIANGVLSKVDIGLGDTDSETFNGVAFRGKVWSFTTKDSASADSGICQINSIAIAPTSYLFATTVNDQSDDDVNNSATYDKVKDSDKVFRATAYSQDQQAIIPVETWYNWKWDWQIDNTSVVKFKNGDKALDDSPTQTLISQNVKDASTLVYAKATITQDKAGGDANLGATKTGASEVYVFLCANPWPPYKDDGSWQPWEDVPSNCSVSGSNCYDTNFKLYYCRDAGEAGTADDLPAILNDKAVIRGSSAEQNILKEFYFFRESTPSVTGVNLATTTNDVIKQGGQAGLTWQAVNVPAGQTLDKYLVYYSTKSKSYTQSVAADSPGTASNPFIVSNLINGATYYFAVTARYKSGAESSYSNETSFTPADTMPPIIPQNVSGQSDAGKAIISWSDNQDDAVMYKVHYGATSGSLGASTNLEKSKCSSAQCAVTISGLNSGTTYYFAVTALDAKTNQSDKSGEVSLDIL